MQRGRFSTFPQEHAQTTLWYERICCAEVHSPVLSVVACSDTQKRFLNDGNMSSSTTIGHVLIVKLWFPCKNSVLTNRWDVLCHWRPCASPCRRIRQIGTPPSAPRRLNSCVRVICHKPHVLSRECAQEWSLFVGHILRVQRATPPCHTISAVACHHGLDGKLGTAEKRQTIIRNFQAARKPTSWLLEVHATEQHAGGRWMSSLPTQTWRHLSNHSHDSRTPMRLQTHTGIEEDHHSHKPVESKTPRQEGGKAKGLDTDAGQDVLTCLRAQMNTLSSGSVHLLTPTRPGHSREIGATSVLPNHWGAPLPSEDSRACSDIRLWLCSFFALGNLRSARNSNPVTCKSVERTASQPASSDRLSQTLGDKRGDSREAPTDLQLRMSSVNQPNKGATQATRSPLATTAPLTCPLRESNTRWKHRVGWRAKLRRYSV